MVASTRFSTLCKCKISQKIWWNYWFNGQSSPLLYPYRHLSLALSLRAYLVLSSIQSREQMQTNAVIRLSDGAEEEGEQAPNVGPNVSLAAEEGEQDGGNGIFYFEKPWRHGVEIFRGWGGWGGGMLHKLSSRSACIAWPTVQKGEWNVGQIPPPLSFSVSVCILFFFFTVTNITAPWMFWIQRGVCGVGR